MKYYIVILIVLLFSSCAKKSTIGIKETGQLRVYKISSINNYHIIYGQRNDSLFKIVSKKEYITNCNSIQKNGSYDLKLHSMIINREIGGIKILPQNSMLVTCFSFDKQTNICIEPKKGIYDLYFAENLKGLCLEK